MCFVLLVVERVGTNASLYTEISEEPVCVLIKLSVSSPVVLLKHS